MFLQYFALLAAGLFSGAAVYVSVVEHPARLVCSTDCAVTQWRPSYRRATVMQASLALAGVLSAAGAWAKGAGDAWLVSSILLAAVIIFTLVVIFPTNRQLEDQGLDMSGAKALVLLEKWGRLHHVRSALGLLSFVIMLASLSLPAIAA